MMMPLEMTTVLAPVFYGMVALFGVSAVGIAFDALRSRERSVADTGAESEEALYGHCCPEAA